MKKIFLLLACSLYVFGNQLLNPAEVFLKLSKNDFSDQDKIVQQLNSVETYAKIDPKIVNTREYVNTLEMYAQLRYLQKKYSESEHYLGKINDIYYNPSISHAYGMSKLFLGDYNGFKYYHNRYKKGDATFNIPTFHISPIADVYRIKKDDKLLVLNEQGMGDEILFSRVFPLLSNNSKEVHIKVKDTFLEYFKEKYAAYKNIRFFTNPNDYDQKTVNEFTAWGLLGDFFASMTEEDMFINANKDVKKFKLPDEKLKIGISYSHGTLSDEKEGEDILKIKELRGVPQEWFKDNLIGKYDVVDFTYNTKIDGIKAYTFPKDFYETYKNLKKENINLVMTVDSAFGHFTADMGIPTIILINKYKDWRWSFNTAEYNKFFNNIKVLNLDEVENFLKNKK